MQWHLRPTYNYFFGGVMAELPSSNLQPTGAGALVFGGREYRPDSAIRELSDDPDPLDPAPGPRDELLMIHDGETRVFRSFEGEPSLPDGPVDTIEYGVFDATVVLSITLLRPPSEPIRRDASTP